MNRRILLIDSDPTFRTTLTIAVQKYRIDVIHEPDADEAIALGATEPPVLLVVGVEEPEKAGFKIFQRLKKGPLSKLPIVLVTGSVAPESFAKHRGLKTHAEEYVDKRTTTRDELAATIDALIGLGEADDDLDIPVEVDDINVGDGNVIEDVIDDEVPPEAEYMTGQQTVGAEARNPIDASVAEDVDDAFLGLMGGDAAPAIAPDELPPPAEADRPEHSVAEAIPQGIDDGGRQDEAFDDFADDFSKDAPTGGQAYELDDVIASKDMIPVEELAAKADAPVEELGSKADEPVEEEPVAEARPSILESQPAIVLDPNDIDVIEDGDVVEDDSGAIPEPVPHPRSADDAAEAAVVQARVPSSPSIDLGLEKIAEDADKEQQSGGYPAMAEDRDQSGAYDRRALRKIGELERQTAQLKAELERARATAEAAAKGGGREQTFLNLREKMMAADNELKKVRAELDVRGEELAVAQARVATLQAFESKAGDLDQKLAVEATRTAAAVKKEQELQAQLRGLEAELGEKADALVATEKARAQLESDLASERALRAANASDAERQLRVEREQVVARHQGEIQALRQELQARHEAALAQLRGDLEAQHAAAVAASVEAARNEVSADAEHAVAQVEAQREADIATLRAEHQAELVRVRGEIEGAATHTRSELEQQLAQTKADYETLLAQTKAEYDGKLEKTQRDLEAQLADAHARIDDAKAAHEQALAQQASTHAAELANQTNQHAAELASQVNQHAAALAARERELTAARQDDAIAHTAALAELKAELDRTIAQHGVELAGAKRELDELIAQHEKNQAALVEQEKAAQARLAQEHADELARVQADRQAALDDIQRAAAEHKAAAERVAEQHREELRATREAGDREVAELRQALQVAKRQMEEAAAKHHAERDQLGQQHAQALAEQEAQHERAMAVANGEIIKVKAVADAEHNRAMAAAKAEHERAVKELEAAHAAALGDVTTERDELKRGLSAARDTIKRSESELATAVQTIADRNAELRSANGAIAERDQRIAELRKEIEAIEQENANYQEQVLRAYQKIKSDEAMVARAKKAMAIALTVLDDPGTPKSEPT